MRALLLALLLTGCSGLPSPTDAQTANEASDIVYGWVSVLSAAAATAHALCIESDRSEASCDFEAESAIDVLDGLVQSADSLETLEDIDGEQLSKAKLLRSALAPHIPSGHDLSYLDAQ